MSLEEGSLTNHFSGRVGVVALARAPRVVHVGEDAPQGVARMAARPRDDDVGPLVGRLGRCGDDNDLEMGEEVADTVEDAVGEEVANVGRLRRQAPERCRR